MFCIPTLVGLGVGDDEPDGPRPEGQVEAQTLPVREELLINAYVPRKGEESTRVHT